MYLPWMPQVLFIEQLGLNVGGEVTGLFFTGITEEEAVAPFIAVLMSSETTGNMTGAVLAAVTRLVQAGAISAVGPLQQLLQVR